MGNNKACKVTGNGSIKIKISDGMERLLQNVRYVPELKCNLISLGLLDKNGFQFQSSNGMLIVSKGSYIVMKGRLRNSLCILEGNIVDGETSLIIDGQDKSKLWHLRMGHIGEKGL